MFRRGGEGEMKRVGWGMGRVDWAVGEGGLGKTVGWGGCRRVFWVGGLGRAR